MEQTSNKQYKKFDIQSIFDLSPPQRVFGLPRALLFRLGLLASFSSTSSSVRVTQSTPFPTGPPRFFFFHLVECSGYPEHSFSDWASSLLFLPPRRVFGLPRALLFRLGLLASFSSTSSSVRVTQSTPFPTGPPRFFFFHLVECS